MRDLTGVHQYTHRSVISLASSLGCHRLERRRQEGVLPGQLKFSQAGTRSTISYQVGFGVMFASDQRHGGARLKGGFDDLVFKTQRKVGETTGWGNCIQDSAH